MVPDFDSRLRAFAEVVVRVGLNLQPGQRLLVAEPYELQGVARTAETIVQAVQAAARDRPGAAARPVEVIWGDGDRLRTLAGKKDWRGITMLVAANAAKMEGHVRHGDAMLFLQGYQARLMDGIPADRVAEARRIGWEHFGPIAQQLVAGATNWTVAPAPSQGWAEAVCPDVPAADRLAALWSDLFAAMRIPRWSATSGRAGEAPTQGGALTAWELHLRSLQARRDELNRQRHAALRYQGEGTDLSVQLPPEHLWCTACLTTRSGLPFVANLPTEEVFTAPQKDSAEGRVCVARPVNYGGAVIEGIELEFRRGRVVQATARTGRALLDQLLETDEGAARLGEVALVFREPAAAPVPAAEANAGTSGAWPRSARLYYHPLLDENSANHVALGEAYGFCLRTPPTGILNRSLIHVDLSLDARVTAAGAALG